MMQINKKCEVCGNNFSVKKSHFDKRRTCGRACSAVWRSKRYTGKYNPNYGNTQEKCAAWKGGRRISNYGYVLIHNPTHPNARPDGYILEHRLVMSELLERPLHKKEVVHHIDRDKTNNNASNLEITSLSEHTALHNKEKEIIRDEKGRIKAVIAPVNQAHFTEVDTLSETKRGTGGFGSTGVKHTEYFATPMGKEAE